MSYFAEALQSDVSDIQQGTTAEGVHLGAMAGTVDLVQRVATGIEVTRDVLRFNPQLPPELERLDMRIRYREIARCRRLYRAAEDGIALLPDRSARCVGAAHDLYGRILDQIEAQGYDVFASRARVSTPRKLAVAARHLAGRR